MDRFTLSRASVITDSIHHSTTIIIIIFYLPKKGGGLPEKPKLIIHKFYTVVQKNAPTLTDYNCDPVQSILIICSKLFANDHKIVWW